jgi:hypothetical protein
MSTTVPPVDAQTKRKLASLARRLESLFQDFQDVRYALPAERRIGFERVAEGLLRAQGELPKLGQTYEERYAEDAARAAETVYERLERQNAEELSR